MKNIKILSLINKLKQNNFFSLADDVEKKFLILKKSEQNVDFLLNKKSIEHDKNFIKIATSLKSFKSFLNQVSLDVDLLRRTTVISDKVGQVQNLVRKITSGDFDRTIRALKDVESITKEDRKILDSLISDVKRIDDEIPSIIDGVRQSGGRSRSSERLISELETQKTSLKTLQDTLKDIAAKRTKLSTGLKVGLTGLGAYLAEIGIGNLIEGKSYTQKCIELSRSATVGNLDSEFRRIDEATGSSRESSEAVINLKTKINAVRTSVRGLNQYEQVQALSLQDRQVLRDRLLDLYKYVTDKPEDIGSFTHFMSFITPYAGDLDEAQLVHEIVRAGSPFAEALSSLIKELDELQKSKEASLQRQQLKSQLLQRRRPRDVKWAENYDACTKTDPESWSDAETLTCAQTLQGIDAALQAEDQPSGSGQ